MLITINRKLRKLINLILVLCKEQLVLDWKRGTLYSLDDACWRRQLQNFSAIHYGVQRWTVRTNRHSLAVTPFFFISSKETIARKKWRMFYFSWIYSKCIANNTRGAFYVMVPFPAHRPSFLFLLIGRHTDTAVEVFLPRHHGARKHTLYSHWFMDILKGNVPPLFPL